MMFLMTEKNSDYQKSLKELYLSGIAKTEELQQKNDLKI